MNLSVAAEEKLWDDKGIHVCLHISSWSHDPNVGIIHFEGIMVKIQLLLNFVHCNDNLSAFWILTDQQSVTYNIHTHFPSMDVFGLTLQQCAGEFSCRHPTLSQLPQIMQLCPSPLSWSHYPLFHSISSGWQREPSVPESVWTFDLYL